MGLQNATQYPYGDVRDIHLFFENILGNVTVLHGVQQDDSGDGYPHYEAWTWSNFSDLLYNSEDVGASLSVPFSCATPSFSAGSHTGYELIIMDTAVTTEMPSGLGLCHLPRTQNI